MKRSKSTATPSEPQPLLGFRTNEEWDDLLAHVDALVAGIEALPDLGTRERVLALLQGIDAIHREALTRLVRLFKEGVLAQVVTDPAIRTLMELYDLIPSTGATGPVPDFITGFPPPSSARGAISQRRVAERVPIPHWVPVFGEAEELASGQIAHRVVEDHDLLLCKVGDEVFALAAACSRDGIARRRHSQRLYAELPAPYRMLLRYSRRQAHRRKGESEVLPDKDRRRRTGPGRLRHAFHSASAELLR